LFRHGEYLIKVGLSAPPCHTKTFLFKRGRRRGDFTERDRLVLTVLQPHHRRLYRAAAARRRAYAALAVLEQVDEQTALVVLAARDTIDVATARAGMLLRAHFFDDAQGASLPREVVEWLRGGSREPLHVHGRARLSVA
jgi:hypothetical protein